MNQNTAPDRAAQVKKYVALTSVAAALVLTGLKLGVGLWSNSLGLLSEAAHSGLDLMAALLTVYAVCAAARPPDKEYPYGQTKMENVSAVLQAGLLLLTCAWIIYEAVDRLFFNPVVVQAGLWAALVMAFSIVVDFSRSRVLHHTARKYNSQALEADALHFSTDIWSSVVVLLGLGCVWLADRIPEENALLRDWLLRADNLAALIVAAVVLGVSVKLGRKGIRVLMDRAPAGLSDSIRQSVAAAPDVLAIRRLRVRQSGPRLFVDMNLGIAKTASLEQSDRIVYLAQQAVLRLAPNADIIVQVEPAGDVSRGLVDKVRAVAEQHNVGVHGIRINSIRDHLLLELHAELPDDMPLDEAHHLINLMEKDIARDLGMHCRIFTHIEPASRNSHILLSPVPTRQAVAEALEHLPAHICPVAGCHNILLYGDPERPSLSLHCRIEPDKTVLSAHEITEDIELHLRRTFPRLSRILIHAEPGRGQADQVKA